MTKAQNKICAFYTNYNINKLKWKCNIYKIILNPNINTYYKNI